MRATLLPGLKYEALMEVLPAMTVPELSQELTAFHDMPPVFATAMMVGFIEATCIECLKPHLEEGEHSVGTHIDMSHVAATPVGLTVRAEIELIEVQKRMMVFKVTAFDDDGLIGEGLHKRAIIDLRKFMSRVSEKKNRS